jgi:hypothetical protein
LQPERRLDFIVDRCRSMFLEVIATRIDPCVKV